MSKISVRVIPRAKQNKIDADGDGRLRVHLTAAPVDGAANDALVRALAKYFDVPRLQIKIVRGETGRDKIIEIP